MPPIVRFSSTVRFGKILPTLGDHRDAPAEHHLGHQTREGRAVEGDRPVLGFERAGERAEQGGLAGAVRAERRDDLAVRDLERNVTDRDDRAVRDGQPLDDEQGRTGLGGHGHPVLPPFVGHA